ncbi:hypothetical protein [Bacillus solimangrovi]|uniref:Uncharacterized protein n=1 Tax=Bacillus solimangrovi TaxID=1305675 RepID=A0A1E5LAP6_9BACI|nr:hypothetical protein [Bacillus solimangrovi]OEH91131.1 hypothetical protein BFG57_07100 [Bacillus solimangrovi]
MENYLKMIVGTLFMLISALLLSSQFITAAILSINTGTLYNVLDSTGYILISLSIIFFLIGFVMILINWSKINKLQN